MLKQNIHKNLKYIGLIAKKSSEIKSKIEFIKEVLKKNNIELILEKETANWLSLDGFTLKEISLKTKVMISLGGDGTLISIARDMAVYGVYVLGIHAGTLGFLTDIKMEEFESFLHDFLNGEYKTEHPGMLDVSLQKANSRTIKKIAFNDVAIIRNSIYGMAKIDAYLNDKYFNTYFGDGIVISSPSGSTAYNMSANGPIIYPFCDVFCVTPICSHSLTQRPLVLPKKYKASFKNMNDSRVNVIIDGHDVFNISDFNLVTIEYGETKTNLIRHAKRNYFTALKEKLKWGYEG